MRTSARSFALDPIEKASVDELRALQRKRPLPGAAPTARWPRR